MMERAEAQHGNGNGVADIGCGVGDGIDRERVNVGNGLHRERHDVVVDNRALTRTQTNNHNNHGNPESTIKHCIRCSSGTRTGNRYYHGHN